MWSSAEPRRRGEGEGRALHRRRRRAPGQGRAGHRRGDRRPQPHRAAGGDHRQRPHARGPGGKNGENLGELVVTLDGGKLKVDSYRLFPIDDSIAGDRAIAGEIEKLKKSVTRSCSPRAATASISRWRLRRRTCPTRSPTSPPAPSSPTSAPTPSETPRKRTSDLPPTG